MCSKPSLFASLMRLSSKFTALISPNNPTSPINTVLSGSGFSLSEDANATAKPKSIPGSFTSKPPATLTKISCVPSGTLLCFCKTAAITCILDSGTPLPTRLGIANCVPITRAWISISRGLVPSTTQTVAEPATLPWCSLRNNWEGFEMDSYP